MNPKTAAALDLLVTRFPAAFFPPEARLQPLTLGIHRDLIAALVDDLAKGTVTKNAIRLCLKCYTRQPEYLKAVAEGDPRIDLEGMPVEPVSPEHQAKAKAMLAERKAVRRKQIREVGEAGAQVRQAEAPAIETDDPGQEKTAGEARKPKPGHPWRTNVVTSKKLPKVEPEVKPSVEVSTPKLPALGALLPILGLRKKSVA